MFYKIKNYFLVVIILIVCCNAIYAQDSIKYSPDATVYYINEMRTMLETSPVFFPLNFSTYLEVDGDKKNIDRGNSVTNNSRVAFSGSTILPIPFIKYVSISTGVTLVGDSLDADSLDSMNMNFYYNMGLVFNNSLLTLGLFGGYKTDLNFGNRYEFTTNEILESTVVTNATDEFKFIFIPIIRTNKIWWLSFLNDISNYINFGSLNPEDKLGFAQDFNFISFKIKQFSIKPSFYYKNERYSSIARNWMIGTHFTIQFEKAANFFAIFDGGYRYFYDYPIMEKTSFLKNSGFIKILGGYNFSEDKKLWGALAYNFRGFGIGLGYQGRVLGVNFELFPRDFELESLVATLGLRLKLLPKQKVGTPM